MVLLRGIYGFERVKPLYIMALKPEVTREIGQWTSRGCETAE